MEHFAGIDVSLEQSSVCVVDATGKVVREAKVASEPEALVRFFRELGVAVSRIGLEAGPLSQWLHAGLAEAGFDAVLLETRHVKAALSAMDPLRYLTPGLPDLVACNGSLHEKRAGAMARWASLTARSSG